MPVKIVADRETKLRKYQQKKHNKMNAKSISLKLQLKAKYQTNENWKRIYGIELNASRIIYFCCYLAMCIMRRICAVFLVSRFIAPTRVTSIQITYFRIFFFYYFPFFAFNFFFCFASFALYFTLTCWCMPQAGLYVLKVVVGCGVYFSRISCCCSGFRLRPRDFNLCVCVFVFG